MPIPDKQVTSVQCTKIKKKDSTPEFTLKVMWSDNTCTERTRNYNNISDFMRILSIITPTDVDLPVLNAAQKFLKSGIIPLLDKKKSDKLDQFFKDLLTKLPNKVLTDDRFISFFEISSTNELKLKYSKILESAQSKDTCRKKSETVRMATKEKFDDLEDNYSSLKLNPEYRPPHQASETYQLPENFLAANIADSNYAQIKETDVGANQNNLKKGGKYWVITNFLKTRNGEVDMEKGDSVSVLDKRPNGQWLVFNKDTNTKGWIPKEILLPDKETIFSETDDDMEFVVVESYKAVNSDEVSVVKGDLIRVLSSPSTGWWMIRIGKSQGRIPGSCIGVLRQKKLESIHDEKDEDSNIHTSRNIEEMYSKVEKIRCAKGRDPAKNVIEKLPSYENLREITSTKTNDNQNENQGRNIPSVYASMGDVAELMKLEEDKKVIRGKSPKKLHRTESDCRQSWSQTNQCKDRTPSCNEPKQRNSSDAKTPQSTKRLSFPSNYCNLKTNQKRKDDDDDSLLYDNFLNKEVTIEKCNKATLYGENDGLSSISPALPVKPFINSKSTNKNGSIKRESNLNSRSHLNQKTPSHASPLSMKPILKAKPLTSPKPQKILPRSGDQTPPPLKPKPKLLQKPKENTPSPKANLKSCPEVKTEEKKYPINDITRAKAEELLQLGIKGAFLFRVPINEETAAILSIFDGTKVRHINVERDIYGELTVGNSNFNSLPEIADYFKQNPVARNARGEELKLTKHLLVH